MEAEIEKTLIIKVKGVDIDILKSGMKKVVQDIARIGLKHTGMTIEEGEMIKDLNTKLHE